MPSNNSWLSTESRETLRIGAQKDEAIALFNANQARRNAADRALALAVAILTLAGSAAAVSKTIEVLLPIPAVLALLFTYQLHVYADITAMGAARLRLEKAVNANLDGQALVYESWVAPVRKSRRYWSMPLAWGLLGLLLLAVGGGGVYVALRSAAGYEVAFFVFTPVFIVCAARAFYEMIRTPGWTDEAMTSEEEQRKTGAILPLGENPFATKLSGTGPQ
jgi:hypothetical protein